ncbi:hypothetical protein [Sphingomonas glaciei]|uniref:Uncharacterized protein n=1 Tax=Sphingomonas glaciei TaxID=2938948 RepID=A0ABY5MRR4_9SPHN|nr:hypothetical protein [Sphingomonas glaciei]UUR06742.1 hypothetical protein M1K48_07170 [Sphingomonas glaciei]
MTMTISCKWRKKADELLAAPVHKKRDITSVAGKVDDRFEAIYAARQRGMAWKPIALALEDGAPIKVDAVESAFTRICNERGVAPPVKAGSRQRKADEIDSPDRSSAKGAETQQEGPPQDDDTSSKAEVNVADRGGEVDKPATAQSNLFNGNARWVDDGE